MFKVNNRNTRKICEICSKLTIKTAEEKKNVEEIKQFFALMLLTYITHELEINHCWSTILDKRLETNSSKIGFSMECFTGDSLQFFTKRR